MSRKIHKTVSIPLYLQIAQRLVEKIEEHELLPGAKLPPERELAEMFNVSRTTAVGAYKHLETLGLIETRVGSGTYVRAQKTFIDWHNRFSQARDTPSISVMRDIIKEVRADVIDLAFEVPDIKLSPVEIFSKILTEHNGAFYNSDFSPATVEGCYPFKELLAYRMSRYARPMTAENIIVTSGAQQALYLLTKILTTPGDTVVTGAPISPGALTIFQAAKLNIIQIPAGESDSYSAMEKVFACHKPKFVYMIPTFQNPCGDVMPLEMRKNYCLRMIEKYKVLMIEDDTYNQIYFEEPPPPPLISFDTYDGIIYIGSFLRTLFPSLRIGYIAGPEEVIKRIAYEKISMSLFNSNINQWMLYRFLMDGYYEPHLELARDEYKKRRDAMREALQTFCVDKIEFNNPKGGLFLWCKSKNMTVKSRALFYKCSGNVTFVPGEAFYDKANKDGEYRFRLCFGYYEPVDLQRGIARLAYCFDRVAKTSRPHAVPYSYTPLS